MKNIPHTHDPRHSMEYWGEAYTRGAEAYDNCPRAKWEIDKLNIKIYQIQPQPEGLVDYDKAYASLGEQPEHHCEYCKKAI